MWAQLQNSRPFQAPTSTKNNSPSIKDSSYSSFQQSHLPILEFKIYGSSPPKTKVPSSEETRQRPLKAYTLRVSGRSRTNCSSFSPTKIGYQITKDSPTSVGILRGYPPTSEPSSNPNLSREGYDSSYNKRS